MSDNEDLTVDNFYSPVEPSHDVQLLEELVDKLNEANYKLDKFLYFLQQFSEIIVNFDLDK